MTILQHIEEMIADATKKQAEIRRERDEIIRAKAIQSGVEVEYNIERLDQLKLMASLIERKIRTLTNDIRPLGLDDKKQKKHLLSAIEDVKNHWSIDQWHGIHATKSICGS